MCPASASSARLPASRPPTTSATMNAAVRPRTIASRRRASAGPASCAGVWPPPPIMAPPPTAAERRPGGERDGARRGRPDRCPALPARGERHRRPDEQQPDRRPAELERPLPGIRVVAPAAARAARLVAREGRDQQGHQLEVERAERQEHGEADREDPAAA